MFLLKLVGKVVAAPFWLMATIVWIIGRIMYEISGTVVGFLILIFGGTLLYYLVHQSWQQVIFSAVTEVLLVLTLFGGALLVCLMEELRNRLAMFIVS